MKELSIEEKAKAYDEALKYAMIYYKDGNEDMKTMMKTCFPILVEESKDERVKKRILLSLEKDLMATKNSGCDTQDLEQCIAWLEKQGEPKEINPSEFDSQLNRLLGQFKSLPKEELASSLSFYLNVVQNNGTYKEEKQGEQKPWSEEDEEIYRKCICAMRASACGFPEEEKFVEQVDNWLKSFKDRVQPQPKQEWCGGDEAHLHSLITHLEQWIERHPNTTGADIQGENITWLKSLRPQSTWKPSDEQIHYLSWIANVKLGDSVVEQEVSKHLNELLEDLKKLKE